MFTSEKINKDLFQAYIGERNALWMIQNCLEVDPNSFVDEWNAFVDQQNSNDEESEE